MKKLFNNYSLLSLLCVCLVFVLTSCQNFVQDVDKPIDSVNDDQLDSRTEIQFLITGVKVEYCKTLGQIGVLSGGLSDELIFDRNLPKATYPQYDEIEAGMINLNNTSVDNALIDLGRFRITADTLVGRMFALIKKDSILRLTTKDTTHLLKDDPLVNEAIFTGYFYGGIARYYWAAYFGLEPTRGGGAIDGSPFIPSDSMFQLAVDKFLLAEKYSSSTSYRLNASFMGRTLLMAGKYKEAGVALESSLLDVDPPFVMKYSNELDNFWYSAAGAGRMQFALNNRFQTYLQQEPLDTARIKFVTAPGKDGTRYLRQNKYPFAATAITAMSWQECYLMVAEVNLRLYPQKYQDAADAVNIVRNSHGLADDTTTLTLDRLFIERDKELNCTGNRLLDERRSGKWHMPAGTWQYLPITNSERSRNPKLK